MSLLDRQIEKDLTDLYYGREMSGAISLRSLGIVKGTNFSTRGLPLHFAGNRNADTVFVMLNPKENNFLADSMFNAKTCAYNRHSVFDFIDSYKRDKEKVTLPRLAQINPFDIKQAAFLGSWTDSGISFPLDFPDKQYTHWDAIENVLNQKLQLELIPYCSDTFGSIKKKDYMHLIPFLENIFDEIVSVDRKYVIFGSSLFYDLFDYYTEYSKKAGTSNGVAFIRRRIKHVLKSKCVHYSAVKISYKEYEFSALIAHSFADRAYNKATSLMVQYGEFCYEKYNMWLLP